MIQYKKTLDFFGPEFEGILKAIFKGQETLSLQDLKENSKEHASLLAEKEDQMMYLCAEKMLWPGDLPVDNFIGLCIASTNQ